MSAETIQTIRDKDYWEPRAAISTFTQLLISDLDSFVSSFSYTAHQTSGPDPGLTSNPWIVKDYRQNMQAASTMKQVTPPPPSLESWVTDD